MLDAVLWVMKTGAPWRDLPERFGPWQTAYGRFRRWRREGLLDRLVSHLQRDLDREGLIDWSAFCIDSTHVRATRSAAGARKKGR
jgi:transposase